MEKPISPIVGTTVSGPIKRMRKPSRPVIPRTACTSDARARLPDNYKKNTILYIYRRRSEASEGYVFTSICLFKSGGPSWIGHMVTGVVVVRGQPPPPWTGPTIPSPPGQDHHLLGQDPPPRQDPPPPIRELWSMCGRYASYWNAFLLESNTLLAIIK